MNLSRLSLAFAAALLIGATTTFAADATPGVPKEYPLTTCPISGEKLGAHGAPMKVTDNGTDVWLCCRMCVKDFKKEPAKYTQMVKDAAAAKK